MCLSQFIYFVIFTLAHIHTIYTISFRLWLTTLQNNYVYAYEPPSPNDFLCVNMLLQINTVTFPTKSKFSWSASCNFSQSARFYIFSASSVCFYYCINKLVNLKLSGYTLYLLCYPDVQFLLPCIRYIFESKVTKQMDSKSKRTKDDKGENISEEKVIARLQVNVI